MLSMKKIDKIRYLYFEVGMPVTDIWRKTGVSKTTIYKYLKEKDFSPKPEKPFVPKPKITDPYIPIVREWLVEDKRKHHKQRHTAKRVYDRLLEMFPDMTASYSTITILYRKIRSEVYYTHKEYAPLRHLPGEAQADVGECVFIEKGIKINGFFVVVSFPYSNAGYCQLYKGNNAQCIIQGIQNIFHHIGGVPHEVTFDNDGALIHIKDDRIPKKTEIDLFLRFKNHYDFRCEYCASNAPNQKGNVESKLKFLRKNLLVPVPEFDDLDTYNRELLTRCDELMNRIHYRTKVSIETMFTYDKAALLPLPEAEFEVATYKRRKVNQEGAIALSSTYIYHINPRYAGKNVRVKLTYNKVAVYNREGGLIVEYDRMYGPDKITAIEWGIWLPIVSHRANSLFHSPLTDMFSETLKAHLLSGSAKRRRNYLYVMAEIEKSSGLDAAIKAAELAARDGKETINNPFDSDMPVQQSP